MTIAPSSLTKRDWIFIVGLTVAARLVVVFGLLGRMPLVKDALDYHHTALAFLNGTAYDQPFYMPPGTGLILSTAYRVLGDSVVSARLVLLACAVATTVGVVLLTHALFARRRISFAAGVIAAVYPPALLLGGQTYSQHFAALALVWVVFGWITVFRAVAKRKSASGGFRGSGVLLTVLQALGTGMIWGVGCLVRPSMLSLAPVFVCSWFLVRGSVPFCGWSPQSPAVNVACFYGRGLPAPDGRDDFTAGDCQLQEDAMTLRQGTAGSRRCVALLAFFIGCAVLVLPVMMFNAGHNAGWVLSTNNERNFFLGNNPYTPLYKTSHLAQRALAEHPVEVQAYLRSYYAHDDPRQVMKAEAFRHIRRRPDLFFLRTLNRVRAFWGFDYLASREIQQWAGWGVLGVCAMLVFEAGGYVAVMVLVVVGAGILSRDTLADREARITDARIGKAGFPSRIARAVWLDWRAGKPALLFAFVIFYQIPYSLAFSAGTYHYPAVWLLMPFAALGLVNLLKNGVWRTLKTLPVWGWAVLGVFLLIQLEYAYFAATYL